MDETPNELVVDLEELDAELAAQELAELDAKELPEPCLDVNCPCCGAWTVHLSTLAEHIRRHLAGEVRMGPCFPECLVCAEVGWQGGATGPAPFIMQAPPARPDWIELPRREL